MRKQAAVRARSTGLEMPWIPDLVRFQIAKIECKILASSCPESRFHTVFPHLLPRILKVKICIWRKQFSWETGSHTHNRGATVKESLDDVLHHLLPWDIQLLIEEPVDESVRRGNRSLSVGCIYSYLLALLRVKTRVWSYNLYTTPFPSHPSQLTLVTLMKHKTVPKVCGQRKREK